MLIDLQSEIFGWVRGALFILALYHFIIYFQNEKKVYLYYSLYLTGMLIYFFQHIFTNPKVALIYEYIDYPIHFLSYMAYIYLGRLLLETKIRIPKYDRYFKIITFFFAGLAILFLIIQVFFNYDVQKQFMRFVGPIVWLLVFFILFVLFKIKLPVVKYFFIGSLIYIICLSGTLFQQLFFKNDYFISQGIDLIALNYFGIFVQAILFAAIIGLSIKRIEQQNKNSEVRLAFKYKELEELKMTALQSQMNPHFLFNSLNSINNFVLKNDIEKASNYITKFSKLIRVILKSSSSTTITFFEEIKILSLYVKLEQMRINEGFEYKTNIDKNINLEEIQVPPLFLQPYIENSIWHGLTHVEGEKRIVLNIFKENENIICEIIDNGIGIDTATERADKNINRRKFFGTQATENRIRLLYKKEGVSIKITDISTETTTGTMVKIIFPYKNLSIKQSIISKQE